MTRLRKLGLAILIADLLAAIALTFGGVLFSHGPIVIAEHDQGNFWYEFGTYGPKTIRKSVAAPLLGIAAVGACFLVIPKRKIRDGV